MIFDLKLHEIFLFVGNVQIDCQMKGYYLYITYLNKRRLFVYFQQWLLDETMSYITFQNKRVLFGSYL